MSADAGAIRQFVRFAAVKGLKLDSILDQDLHHLVKLAEEQNRIPESVFIDVLDHCALAANIPTLGIEFAHWSDLHGFSLFCLLGDHCTTLLEASRLSRRYRHIETTSYDSRIEPAGDETMIHYTILAPTRHGGVQYTEFLLAISVRFSRMILGEKWNPIRVEIRHPAPTDTRRHTEFFGCAVAFASKISACVIRPADLFIRTSRGNPRVLDYLVRQLDAFEREPSAPSSAEVARMIDQELSCGRATLKNAAVAAGVTPRTLQRRLAAEGTEFSLLVEQARLKLAEQFFKTERNPHLTQLAMRLGYAETSAASRFLQRQFGTGLRELARDKSNFQNAG
ncbi:AraC family transcriptional regulator ligand-binding domain-containing protein [Achromobacter sp.]|uniref:AraC family transcriptional regulator n=1 Tax=Achromobacter sp. TaxID=134375 RepID=UPI003C740F25